MCARPSKPPISLLRRELESRGIDTRGLYERAEFVRLLAESEGKQQRPRAGLPEVGTMTIQEMMEELDLRAVSYDVLSPSWKLAAELQRARAGQGQRVSQPPTPPTKAPSPPVPRRAMEENEREREELSFMEDFSYERAEPSHKRAGQSQQSQRSQQPGVEERGEQTDRARAASSPAAMPSTDAAVFVDGAVEAVGSIASKLASATVAIPAIATDLMNVSSPTAWHSPVPQAWKESLTSGPFRRLRPPPKPVLLVICLCALRYGIGRTLIVALAALLSLDIVSDVMRNLQGWKRDHHPRKPQAQG
ncbi:MAG: hypothetical protein SGPRY_010944 [Prymnesium sp.]